MSIEDFRINAFVRQVLSCFWVDLADLRFGVVGGVVYVQGRFQKVRPPDQRTMTSARMPQWVAENAALLETVEKEIRREALVTDVVFRLSNFRKANGKWIPVGA